MKGLIFTYVLTYGGALVSLVKPFYGFLIYVCFGIIKPDALWHWSVPPGNYSRTVAIGLLIGWLINGLGNWQFRRGGLIVGAMVAYWCVMVFCAMMAPHSGIAWPAVESMAKVFLPILVGATLIDSSAKLRQLAWVIVVSQGYLAFEFNLTYYTTILITTDWTHGGLDNNGIAITMVTSVGLAFYLGLHSSRWWQKTLAYCLAGLMAHVVIFSNSRGGMLSLLITGSACFVLTRKKPRDYLILLIAIAVVIRLTGAEAQKRFMSAFAESGTVADADKGGRRLDQWAACWDSMQKNPLGVGPSHWPIVAKEVYGLPAMAAHSTWLQTGAELGIPGLACLLGFYGLSMVRLWRVMRDRTPGRDPWLQYFARMVIASLIGFLISASFVSVDGVELPYYIVLIGIGTLRLASQPQTRQLGKSSHRPVIRPYFTPTARAHA